MINKYQKENEENNMKINNYIKETEEKNNKLKEFMDIVTELQNENKQFSEENEKNKKILEEKNQEINNKNIEIKKSEEKNNNNINILNNLQKQLKENSENYLIEKKNYLDKISDIEKNFEILSQEKNELNLTHAKEKNEYEKKITELMDILKEYEHENKEIGVNTDEYLLNQKLNDLYNKEKKKLEEDIIKYENMAKNKPYQCSICKKNFSLDVKLKEHMLEHTTIKSEEEMESDENKNIINNENKDNIEKIKEEIKNDKEETIDNNNINNNASTNNNNKIGLGFFGRIMAPIFLTESEINSINGQ